MNQEKVWNKIASAWSKYRKNALPEVLEFLKNKKGRLLDLGCGSGRNFVNQEGLEIYGVDFSDNMLSLAKQKAEQLKIKVHLKKSSADKLEYDNEFFDYAIFISALHCIPEEKLRKKSLQELFRVLKPDAEAMISVWNRDRTEENKEQLIDWKNEGLEIKRYYYFFDEDELEYLLKEVGFTIINLKIESSIEKSGHSKKNIIFYVKK